MEAKARLTQANINIATGRTCLTFEFDHLMPEAVDAMQNIDLRITAVKWREKRSLTANAYFHVLVAKIAEAIGVSDIMAKNMMIARYGQIYILDCGEPASVLMLAKEDYRKCEAMHLQPTASMEQIKGKMYQWHIVMKNSRKYDSKEMARLIDGTVSEAKELGIETLPPHELERMVKQWQGSRS